MRTAHSLAACAVLALLGACATPQPAATSAATPAPAVSAKGVTLINPGFESTAPGRRSDPEGWFTFQHAGDKSYNFTLDTSDPHGGSRSLRIENVGPEPYGAVAQSVEAAAHAGKVARYSAWMKTRDANDTGAVLTILVLANGAVVAQNFMADAPVKGSKGWARYTITLPVAKNAERVEIGAMMQGKGSLWLDDVELVFE
jgi:hypothetical protein